MTHLCPHATRKIETTSLLTILYKSTALHCAGMSASQSDRFSHMVQTTWMHLSRESPWRMERRWTRRTYVDAMISEAAGELGYEMVRKYMCWGRTFSLVELFCQIVSNESRTFFPLRHIRDALAKETWQCSNCIPQWNKVCYSVPRPFLRAKGLARETSPPTAGEKNHT